MSIVAEFARELHENYTNTDIRELSPVSYHYKSELLTDIRVVVFDVYGTLYNYWKPEFSNEVTRQETLLSAFKKTISFFKMDSYLQEMDPDALPEKTLWDLYHGLITLKHDLALDKKIEFPEVRIEEIWEAIVLMLKRRGYNPSSFQLGTDSDFVKCLAYYYNFVSFNRSLYPGVADTLRVLREGNIRLGIISNAQFYTPIDLTLLLRDQSNNAIDDYLELFEQDLIYYSYEYGVSKPNPLLFQKLFDALYEYEILPSQALYIGNDLSSDIKPAIDAGMKTALFCGDSCCTFFHEYAGLIVPDISFSTWSELAKKVSFHSDSNALASQENTL